jgi:hypothetical protein
MPENDYTTTWLAHTAPGWPDPVFPASPLPSACALLTLHPQSPQEGLPEIPWVKFPGILDMDVLDYHLQPAVDTPEELVFKQAQQKNVFSDRHHCQSSSRPLKGKHRASLALTLGVHT